MFFILEVLRTTNVNNLVAEPAYILTEIILSSRDYRKTKAINVCTRYSYYFALFTLFLRKMRLYWDGFQIKYSRLVVGIISLHCGSIRA